MCILWHSVGRLLFYIFEEGEKMGIRIAGTGDQEKITFSCDHPGCTRKTVRAVCSYRYDRYTGQTYRTVRRPQSPVAYWGKVLRKPRRRNIRPFFLLGSKDDWSQNIKVFCEEHFEQPKPKSLKRRWSDRDERRYQRRRVDVF